MSVYTSLEATDISRFLELYSQGELLEFSGIAAGIENTNYFVTTKPQGSGEATREFVLTLFETTPADNLDAYFRLMARLAKHRLPAALPIKNREGFFLGEIKSRPAVLIKRLPGSSVSTPSEVHCARAGAFLANMHTTPDNDVEPIVNFRGAGWRATMIDKLHGHCADEEILLLEESHARACQFENADLPKGNVHGDFFHDNALFIGEELTGVIDFYYAHHTAYIYDLAVAFADWCYVQNHAAINTGNAESMIQAYTTLRPLSETEAALWPTAIELASLRFLLSRLHDKHFPREGSLTQEKDPTVFQQLLEMSYREPKTLIDLLPFNNTPR